MKCIDCPSQIYNHPHGRRMLRCQPCKKKERKDRYWGKKAKLAMQEVEEDIHQAYLDSIPTHEEVFGHHHHDSGTGIDQGSSED